MLQTVRIDLKPLDYHDYDSDKADFKSASQSAEKPTDLFFGVLNRVLKGIDNLQAQVVREDILRIYFPELSFAGEIYSPALASIRERLLKIKNNRDKISSVAATRITNEQKVSGELIADYNNKLYIIEMALIEFAKDFDLEMLNIVLDHITKLEKALESALKKESASSEGIAMFAVRVPAREDVHTTFAPYLWDRGLLKSSRDVDTRNLRSPPPSRNPARWQAPRSAI